LQALARSPYFVRLERLDLSGNHIDRLGARALLDSAHFPRLAWVPLDDNDIPEELLRAVEARFAW
jgi:hypothetical protein